MAEPREEIVVSINETALFLFNHTDWKSVRVDTGSYVRIIAYYTKEHGELIDETSAETKIRELWNECEDLEEWEVKFSQMAKEEIIPYSIFVEDDLELTCLLEDGKPITDLIHKHYMLAAEEDEERQKVTSLVGGVDAMKEIVSFVMANPGTDHERIYSELRDRYCKADWYRES